MPITLAQVVPWGRTLDEYRGMFTLSDDHLNRGILGVGDGPASFNAQATALGGRITSIDPIYHFSAPEIRRRVEEVAGDIVAQVRRSPDEFVWTFFRDPDHLKSYRLAAMEEFLRDFDLGKSQGRYIAAALPSLPFAENAFPLAVCSHLLFLYADQLSAEFHLAAITELLRIAPEVRIFPLLKLGGAPSPHVPPITRFLRSAGHTVDIVPVSYEFQRGGNQMMRIRRK